MTGDQRPSLVERLEATTGPDRELDRLIEETLPGVLRHPHRDMVKDGYVISDQGHPTESPGQGYPAPDYTWNLKAALKLLMKNWHWSVSHNAQWDARYAYHASCGPDWIGQEKAYAPTPALAFCIAALKAREALHGEQPPNTSGEQTQSQEGLVP